MLRSMTGYGRGEVATVARRITVELKAVNHRFNDISIKLPRTMNYLEDRIRKRVTASVFRGKTDVFVSVTTFPDEAIAIQVNKKLADAYYDCLQFLTDRYHLEAGENLLPLLAKFPDVLAAEQIEADEDELSNETMAALDIAIGRFLEMRGREGEALRTDILKKAETIEDLVNQIRERTPFVTRDYRVKLEARLQELLGEVELDQARLTTEVMLFADRCCIDEELIRLYSHIEQLRQILGTGGQVGRKLDFLVQEMNREANTIASKSNDLQVTRAAVDLKSEIEKVREQVQNIE